MTLYTGANKYIDSLVNVIDPELHVDIVNLGLIRDIQIDAEKMATVTMTLTIMGCPLSDFLFNMIREELRGFD